MCNQANFIWNVSELLRGSYKQNDYREVILPFVVLRRIDCVLEPLDAKIQENYEIFRYRFSNPEKVREAICQNMELDDNFCINTSGFNLKTLLDSKSSDLLKNFELYLEGFNNEIRDLFERFKFHSTLEKLHEKDRLKAVLEAFVNIDLSLEQVSNHEMGSIFEEILRRFNDVSAAGEQYTPRDAANLIARLVLSEMEEQEIKKGNKVYDIYDPAAGTGGLLSSVSDYIKSLEGSNRLNLHGQEIEDETYAICKADMILLGNDSRLIRNGDSLVDDKFEGYKFDLMVSNPPYGVDWKSIEKKIREEYAKGFNGKFGPGLPRVSDGQLLFTLHLVSKMREVLPDGSGGSRIAIVHNGSPLFTGDAGSGESEIRRYLLENDLLEAIVALPMDMFYNTGIATYLWFLTNNKSPERKGKVQFVDASGMGTKLRKSLGKKRVELTEETIEHIYNIYRSFTEDQHCKILDYRALMFRKITIERPMRIKYVLNSDKIDQLLQETTDSRIRWDMDIIGALAAEFSDLLGEEEDIEIPSPQMRDIVAAVIGKNPPENLMTLLRKIFAERDEEAEVETNNKGEVIYDPSVRDTENVPYGMDIREYMEQEVLPHLPDAVLNTSITDPLDGKVGVVGCEINFNRLFYVYNPPRPLSEIDAELKQVEAEIAVLLEEMTK